MILSIVTGGFSGASNAALLAVINLALRKSGSPSTMLVWSFAGLCLLLCFSRYTSGIFTYQYPVFKAQRWLRKAREEGNAVIQHFQSLVQGSKELKLHHYRRHAFFSEVLEPTAASFRRYNVAGMKSIRRPRTGDKRWFLSWSASSSLFFLLSNTWMRQP